MKNVLITALLTIGLFFINNLQAQEKDNITTTEIEVKGVCGMCKERIENAAYIKGVKKADWDKKTHVLTVVFRNDKTTEDKIHESIAKAGHETNKLKADPKAYKNLPACCSYDDGVETH